MSETDLTLTGLTDEEVMAVLGGISSFQMQALTAGDLPKVNAAGGALTKLAEENPEAIRHAFLEHRQFFRVAQMPEELLDRLDLAVKDGRLCRPDGDDGWVAVEVE